MKMSVPPNVPRFHTLWQHIEKDKRIFAIRKEDWDSLKIENGTDERVVKLNMNQFQPLPIQGIITGGDLITATASATKTRVIIKIYRKDPRDEPKPINVDTYTIWKGLPPYLDVSKMIIDVDTDSDVNFWHYADDHVFLIKEEPGDDHWPMNCGVSREHPSTAGVAAVELT